MHYLFRPLTFKYSSFKSLTFKSLTKVTIATSLSLALAACGGGGSGGSSTPVVPPIVVDPVPSGTLEDQFALYLADLTDGNIIPRYTAMQVEAQTLKNSTDVFCALPAATRADLVTLQQNWQGVNDAWQQIQWLKVGAVVENDRLLRMQLWPDDNDAVGRGVADLVAEQFVVTAEYVSGQNLGAQGLPALEYLLFPEVASDSLLTANDREKRCEVSSAIAQNVLNMSTAIATDWQTTGGNYRAEFVGGTGDFTSIQNAVEELTTNWLQHIEIVEDTKLNEVLGDATPGNARNAEHYLSDTSLISIGNNIQTFLSIYTNEEGVGFDSILVDFLEQVSINTEITTSLTDVNTQIEQINQDFDSYETMLADSSGREALTNLVTEMRVLIDLIDMSFTQALDLNLGFNSTDGD
ncbi:MAG: putative lipoprotein [Paraglaciecola sp.]|jgi:predicted lipoprotein